MTPVPQGGRRQSRASMQGSRTWDVFCHVVDNYGDAAVCWRLAQRLAAENCAPARLWIDNLAVLHALRPEVAIDQPKQSLGGVEICHWVGESDFGPPADVVIDAFGCGLPDEYAEAMAARVPESLWVVLEYLSAEPWVVSHHGLPSPHPRLALERYFFFPGFEAGTGGLLREPELAGRREEFLRHPVLRQALWHEAGFSPPDREATLITLFGYENPAVAELLEAWASGAAPVVAAVPRSRLSRNVAAYFGASEPAGGKALRRGALEARFLPFLSQDRYDELLWAADWNFVRGEDSFVRAQWAERPLVWHLYPQAESAHLAKLEAFLVRYCRGLPEGVAGPLRTLWRSWNDPARVPKGALGEAWAELSGQGPVLCEHAHTWALEIAATGDLAVNLAKFCVNRLK
jgi:uncharacterized repeat protein (TIGR03837 family)